MSVIEDKLLKESEALKAELEKVRKAAEENANYKAFIENRVNQKAKDSVFIDLFSSPENQLLLYRELFPKNKTITSADLELFTV